MGAVLPPLHAKEYSYPTVQTHSKQHLAIISFSSVRLAALDIVTWPPFTFDGGAGWVITT